MALIRSEAVTRKKEAPSFSQYTNDIPSFSPERKPEPEKRSSSSRPPARGLFRTTRRRYEFPNPEKRTAAAVCLPTFSRRTHETQNNPSSRGSNNFAPVHSFTFASASAGARGGAPSFSGFAAP